MISNDSLVSKIESLLALFREHCTDLETISELQILVAAPARWPEAHKLFQRIRLKNLAASKARDLPLEAQYCFEEICAKSLYNLSQSPAPFDSDSPDWLVPNAMSLAKCLQINQAEVSTRLGV